MIDEVTLKAAVETAVSCCGILFFSFVFAVMLFSYIEDIILTRSIMREFRKNKEKYINDYLDRHPKFFIED